jgi:pimeloyl-ACP methyl ester carboxylesterase
MGFDDVRRVQVGDHEVAYREEGSGPPLLLVHGWPLSSRTWRKVVPGLADSFRCIAIDLLGAGETLPPEEQEPTIGMQGNVVIGLANALGLDRFALVGHDSGGSVARAAAVAAPDRVTHLILADTEIPAHRPPLVVAFQMLGRLPGSQTLLRLVLGSKFLARTPLGFGLAFADRGSFDFDEFHDALLGPLAASEAAMEGCGRFLEAFDFAEIDALRPRYDMLRMPKLVLWGERDRFFPLAEGKRLADMLPAPTHFVQVPNAGLLVHEERPEAWTRPVRELLEANAPAAVAGSS